MGVSRAAGAGPTAQPASAAAGIVLLTLASAQFLMTLDSSVMNVSIATVAKDVGTTVTGIQTAITFYTLVMASLMITGGKVGQILGRKRAFAIGCVIYGCGSLTTALAGNLAVLIVGWSVLEGVGAALIMPAIVALVASNFARDQRPRAYGLVASAGAIAVAAGPLIGGLLTTYASWRWVFAGEVVVVLLILVLTRRIADTPAEEGVRLDLVGTVLSALGLGLVVYGVLRSGTWGFVQAKSGAPEWLGLSPVIWLILAGGIVLRIFLWWESHRLARGASALVDPAMLRNPVLRGGLIAFFFQYLLQAGLFFAVPLFLSVALGLSAIATGVRLLPLSITLLLAAVGVPRVFPHASPRRVVRIGFLALFAGIVVMVSLLEVGAGPEIVTWPMLLAGLGIGALASQLGGVTVSSVPDEQSGEVGGVQNTMTNLGASIGTALAGAVLISALTASFLGGVQNNPDVPKDVVSQAQVKLAGGAPFISDKDLKTQLDKAGVPPQTADAIVKENEKARIDGLRASLSLLALIALLALFASRRIPAEQPSAVPRASPRASPSPDRASSQVAGRTRRPCVACKRNAMKPCGPAQDAGRRAGGPCPGQPEGATVTATTAGHPPVLRFDSQPDGGPPPLLCAGGHDYAFRPAGGPPMLILRRRPDVIRVLTDSRNFGMAAVTRTGGLLRCPLTGAEMQSTDGGLLNMNMPQLRSYRRRIAGLFTRPAAETTRPLVRSLASSLAGSLQGCATADALTGFAEPFTATAVSAAMGTPLADWDQILEASRVAFAIVPGPETVDDVAAAWDDLYGYYIRAAARPPGGGLTTQLARALAGHTAAQIARVTATVSNGFGAMLPVLAVAITELAQQPHVVAACTRGERTWASVARELLSTRTLFPIALPRVALADTWLGGRPISTGTTVLPSLIAAAHDGPASAVIPFGAGSHFCPGAALARLWLSVSLEAFFGTFPRARLAGDLDWQPGTLPVPRQVTLALR